MDVTLQQHAAQLKSRWQPYSHMWTHYWMKLLLVKSYGAWQLQGMYISGRFSVDELMRPSTVQSASFFVTSRIISHDIFSAILEALTTGSDVMIPGLPGPFAVSTTNGQETYSEGSRVPIGRWMNDISEGCLTSVCDLQCWGQSASPGSDEFIAQLHAEAQKTGYESFNELSEAQVQHTWESAPRPTVMVTLPLAFKVDATDVDSGKVRIWFRDPIKSTQIEIFLVDDNRWSDDLPRLHTFTDPERQGWQALRLDLRKLTTTPSSQLWIKYNGALDVPRVLKLAVGRSSKYGLDMINKFVYGTKLPKALRSGQHQLEVAVLNALAGLDLTVFYCGVTGRQLEGTDIVAVDRENRMAAVIEVTSQSYRRAVDDKRPVVAAAAQRLKNLLPHDWTVYAVLALSATSEQLDAAHRQSVRTANVVLITQDDLDWLGSSAASASDWWSKLYVQSFRPYDIY